MSGNTANGFDDITVTGARVKPQGMGGYRPPGRNVPTCGSFVTCEIDNPFDGDQDWEDD
jgi:hypothetical protein